MMNKKGMGGIMQLILLIAAILIVVISAVYILEIGFTMEQKSYSTTNSVKKMLTNKVYIDEMSSVYTNNKLMEFQIVIQLLPSSDLIQFNNLEITIQTGNASNILNYRDNGTITQGNAGYNTWGMEHIGYLNRTLNYTMGVDFDDDGHGDNIDLNTSGHIILNFSSSDSYAIPKINCNNSAHLENRSLDVTIDEVRSIKFVGVCGNQSVPDNVTFIIEPRRYGQGYYSLEYLKSNALHHVDGRLNSGEMVRIFFELSEPLGVDKDVTILLSPADGNPTEKRFTTPSYPGTGRIFFE